MEQRFYDSVDIPEDISETYNRIFYLRNLFQDPNLFSDELKEVEEALKDILPILDEPEGEIETYEAGDLSMGQLEELYKDDIRPIVIRGFAKDHDSVKLWTPEFFKKVYGDYKIFFTSTQKIFNEEGSTLAEFIDSVLAGSKNRAYIENMSDIFNDFPELHEHVGIEKLEKYFGNYAYYHKIAQLFIGGLSTGAVFHCANELNCFFNVYGHKKWTFVHPKYSIAMGTTIMNKGYFVGSFVKHRSPKGFIEANTPLYNRIPRLSIVLKPGDVLFNPPWWWHAIDNKTPSTIAVATRWQIDTEYIRQNPSYDMVQSMRLERLSSFGNQIKNGQVVIPDTRLRRNYVSYEKMGWKGK